ncbi:hypothetical protein VP01_3056g2, partial [Puccinia sorghi]
TKHLDIKMKWLRELKDSNQINVKLIPSENMVADALTKPSSAESLKRLQERYFHLTLIVSSSVGLERIKLSTQLSLPRTRPLLLMANQPSPTTTAASASKMDQINSTILKTAIEAIPLFTLDNYTLWKNWVENMLHLQELRTPLTTPTGVLSTSEDVQLRTILTFKLESSIHENVITHENEKSSKKIWKSISDYFASAQASNRARVFNAILDIQFNPSKVQDFITQIKTTISRLHKVGIELPKDIVAYLILNKLPPSVSNISQQITHSEKEITPKLVLDHLRLYMNDQQFLATNSSSKTVPTSLHTEESRKCKKGWHNPNAAHPKATCWFLYPHLRPGENSGETSSLGHVSYHQIRQKLGIPLRNTVSCEACALSKITRASFKSKHKKASRPFEELHLDLIGPISPTSHLGDRYILTVVDSHTRFCSAIPIASKSDVFETLTSIIDFEAKRLGYYPSFIHSDRGGEFINASMDAYCKQHLIKSRTSDPYTPQQNGLAERHNRTIIESLRTILTDSKLNKKYWSDIVKKPASKLYPKGSRGKLIGYNEELLSYRILAEDGRIVETKSVQFLDFLPEKQTLSDNDNHFEIVYENLYEATPPLNENEDQEVMLDEDQIEIKEEPNENLVPDPEVISGESDDEVTELLVPPTSGRVLRERTARIKPVKHQFCSIYI